MRNSLHHFAAIAIVVGWTMGVATYLPGQRAAVRPVEMQLAAQAHTRVRCENIDGVRMLAACASGVEATEIPDDQFARFDALSPDRRPYLI